MCRAVFNISIEAPPERLSARISARTSGPLRLATSSSIGAYELTRSRRDIASAPADHYSVFLQQSGCSVINHSDETVAIYSNDIAIYDGRLPFHGTFFDGKRTIAVIPRHMVEQRGRRDHGLTRSQRLSNNAARDVTADRADLAIGKSNFYGSGCVIAGSQRRRSVTQRDQRRDRAACAMLAIERDGLERRPTFANFKFLTAER